MRAMLAVGDRLSPDQFLLEQQQRRGEGDSPPSPPFEQQRWRGEGDSPPSPPCRTSSKGPATRTRAALILANAGPGVPSVRTKSEDWLAEGMGGTWPLFAGQPCRCDGYFVEPSGWGCGPATASSRGWNVGQLVEFVGRSNRWAGY